jgi:iron complex outermembrane receptor protein
VQKAIIVLTFLAFSAGIAPLAHPDSGFVVTADDDEERASRSFDTQSDAALAKEPGRLQDVVVTAQRRAENLQTIPLTVNAISAADLLNAGVTDTSSLSLAVPGLSYTLGANATTPFIRGIGTTTNSVGSEASVATYVDGVYIASINASLFEFNNIDRLEVLKGPQGTLFGRNATGGVIQIVTKDPSSTASADMRADFGNYDTTGGSFYGTTGIGSNVAVDLAAYGHNQADGWGTDLVTGQPTFTRHDFGGRSKLLWTPRAGERILISIDHNRARNEDGLGYHVVAPGIGSDAATRYNGFYNTYDNPNDSSDVRQTGVSVRAEQDFSISRLVSITSWRNVNGSTQFDQDATPLAIVEAPISQHDRTITQEVQLLSAESASLPWIAGLYYFDDFSAYDPLALSGVVAAPLDELQIWSAQKSKSYAAFGQMSWRIATDTHLTTGARYTKDDRAVTGSTLGRAGEDIRILAHASQGSSWSKLTWRAVLDHRFTPEIMTYLSADRGFKSGIYNLVSYAGSPVRPETLDAYELGIKTEFADDRVRLNAAVFYYNYKDLQVQKIVTGATVLVNAAGAVMKGADADFVLVPTDALTVRGGVELMSGHYNDFRDAPFFTPLVGPSGNPVGGNSQSVGDATDLDTVRTPKRTANVSADYRVAAPSGDFHFNASYYYNSGFAWDPDGRLRQPGYDVTNASVEWIASSHAWGVRLWGRNLAGTHYCAYAASRTLLDSCSPAPPRTFGVTFTAHYQR